MQYYLSIPDNDITNFKYYHEIQKDRSSSSTTTPKKNSKTSGEEENIGYFLDLSPNSHYLIAGSALHTIMNQNVSRIVILIIIIIMLYYDNNITII